MRLFDLSGKTAIVTGSSRVRINCIAPGLVRTDFARALWEDPDTLARLVEPAPLMRISEPEEIGGAAAFLATPTSRFMTGQTVVIDGGVMIATMG